MPTFVDLLNQVQGTLPTLSGGTANEYGGASENLVVAFLNDGTATLDVGSIVTKAPTLTKATSSTQRIVGVVVGRYTGTAAFDPASAAVGDMAAVCVYGRCYVQLAAAVDRDDFLLPSSTAGKATGSASVSAGSIGRAIHAGTTETQAIVDFGNGAAAGYPTQYYTINFLISAGGASIPQIGNQGAISIDAPGTIVSARMLALSSGSAVVDIEKATYSGYPTTSSICASAKPTLSSAQKSEDTTLSGWTTTIAAGDVLVFQLDSISGIFVVTCALKVRRS